MLNRDMISAPRHALPRVVGSVLRVLSRAAGAARFVMRDILAHDKALALEEMPMQNTLVIAKGVATKQSSCLPGLFDWIASAMPRNDKNTPRSLAVALLAAAFGLAAHAPVAYAATAFNTPITNTATASFAIGGTPVTTQGSVTVNTTGRTPATIEFLQYVPGTTGGSVEQVNQTFCGGNNQTAPQYIGPPAASLSVPGALRLQPTEYYSNGDPLFVRVTDYDQNLDANALGTITITVTAPTGDSETLTLTETGNSTGVFIGYLQSTGAAATQGNCVLSIAANQKIDATYTDLLDLVTTVADAALVDPFGILFDSQTGAPVNGATVTLIDDATGLPATVYCDDGVTVMPQPVISGGTTVCDPTMDAGGYRFPRVAPGTYRIAVTAPAGYSFPSLDTTPAGSYTVVGVPGNGPSYGNNFPLNPGPAVKIDIPLDPSGTGLQITKTAKKSIVALGEFVPYTLSIRNSSAVAALAVQISDRLPAGFRYQQGSARLNGVAIANPVISADGRTLTFSIGNIAANATVTLKYVALVGAGAKNGQAENTAAAIAPHSSNTARANVFVRNDLFRDQAILIGRVIVGSCDDKVENDDKGLEGARVLLQDGRYVQTDSNGRWHMDNIRPGTHVVQLDLDSLPEGYEAVACEKNTRFAARSYSQFVNVRGGSLWRADFHVRKKAPEAICLDQKLVAENNVLTYTQTYPVHTLDGSITLMLPKTPLGDAKPGAVTVNSVTLNGQPLEAELSDGLLVARLPSRAGKMTDSLRVELSHNAEGTLLLSRLQVKGLPAQSMPPMLAAANGQTAQCAPVKMIERNAPMTEPTSPETPNRAPGQKQQQLVEKLPYDEKWLAAAQPGVEWLHPQESFQPALPAIKVAIKSVPGHVITLKLNGEAANPLNYDGAEMNAERTISLASWRGLPLVDGKNTFEVIVKDGKGQEVFRQQRVIYYASAPAKVELVSEQSRLLADGKTRPVVAVRLLDKSGKPVRRGINGEFQINAPYVAWDKQEGIERAPLLGRVASKPRYEITADGTALIELEPTTQSGEVVLSFQFGDGKPQEIRAWLKPGSRDWVLVGFAEGTLGHKQLSGNKAALKEAAADDKLYDGNRIAFYAKGMVKGEYLLTIAYDTAKKRGDAGSTLRNLRQAVDPNQYYTLYADATSPQFDAASASKLYVKLERSQFYALFGDYDTGLSVTEFARYSRTLNGLKSEYKGDKFSYNAFATLTAQAFVKDEIPGDGISGLYRLSRGNIVINSDKIRIETRDRFHSEVVLKTQSLSRYLDYDIDYVAGTVFFRSPVAGRDENFNPNFIVAEYESEAAADKKLTYGGRVAYKPTEKLEIGATHIHQGNVGSSGNLSGADATLQIDDKTKLKAEFATSNSNNSGVKSDGNAWKVELTRDDQDFSGKAYVREQQGGFGLGQQAGSENGTRKIGADARLRLSESLQVQGEVYRQDTLSTGAQRNVAEGRVEWRNGDLSTHAGLRFARDEDGLGTTRDSRQVILGAGYEMLDKKLVLRGSAEVDFSGGGGESVDFPDRYKLGLDYKLTEQSTMFAEQEFARGDKLSADITRVGIRTKPWSGGELAASLGNDLNNDAGRLFASLGLTQKWQISEIWAMDFGVDRVNTLSNKGVTPLNLNVPLSSGTINGDYTALYTGVTYTDPDKLWSANARVEWRTGDTDDKINVMGAVQRNLDQGRSVAAGFAYSRNESATGTLSSKMDLRLSYAFRPNDSQWVMYDRLDFISDLSEDAAGKVLARKLVNNFNANWMPNRRTQIAMQYGAKYVFDTIDGKGYDGYSDLIGFEIRRDISQDWDIGLHGSILHTWRSGQFDYGLGASVGYKLMDNTWVAVGYNWLGFEDEDFSGAAYRAKGFYAAMRMKFDQDTLGLNKPDSIFTKKP